jgi:hypothetical protein
VGGYGLFWLTTIRDLRFLLPVVPVLAVVLAVALAELRPVAARIGRSSLVALVSLALVAPGAAYAVYKVHELGPPPVTREGREAFLLRMLPGYDALQLLNTRHGDDYAVYCLGGEELRYHADGRFIGDLFGPARYARVHAALTSGRALLRTLDELGADHLLVFTSALAVPLPDDSFFARHFRLVRESPETLLYEIRYPPGR